MGSQLFTGRETELMQLEKSFAELFGRATSNKRIIQGKVILIEGESGIGKTSLMQQFIQLHKDDNTFFHAFTECSVNELMFAYKPLKSALFRLNEQQAQANRKKESLRSVLSFVQEVSPKWISLIPVFGSITAVTMETAMSLKQHLKEKKKNDPDELQLYEAINKELREIAAERPVILFFDDIQWMDMASAGLLMMLIRSLTYENYRILFILSCSTGPTGKDSSTVLGQPYGIPLAQRIGQYTDDHQQAGNGGWFEKITLPPFTEKEIDALLLKRFPCHRFPESFASRLHEVSHGQARFICEIIEMQERRQIIHQTAGVFTLTSDNIHDLPLTVSSAMNSRIAMLDKKQQRLLAYASVEGQSFEVQTVGKILKADELEMLDDAEELCRKHQLLSAGPTRYINNAMVDVFRFIDKFTHRHIYENMDNARRRALHRHYSGILSETFGDILKTDDELFYKVNRHRWIGEGILDGITGKVIGPEYASSDDTTSRLYMDAARGELTMMNYCLAQFAWNEVIIHAGLALDYAEYANNTAGDYHALLFDILSGKYASYNWLGLYSETAGIAGQLMDVAVQSGSALLKGEALICLGRAYQESGNPTKAEEHYLEALALMSGSSNAAVIARLNNLLGQVADVMRRFGEAIGYFGKAAGIHREIGCEEDLASDLLYTGISYRKSGDLKAASGYFAEAAALAETRGLQSLLASVWNQRGLLYLQEQVFNLAEDCFNSALKIDEVTHNSRGKADRLLNLGRLESDRGNERAAIDYYLTSLTFFNLTEDYKSQINVTTSIAQSWLALNEYIKAEEEINKAFETNSKLRENPNISHLYSTRGDVFMATARLGEALENYIMALETDRITGEKMALINDHYKLALYFKATGEQKTMQQHLDAGLLLAGELSSKRDLSRFNALME